MGLLPEDAHPLPVGLTPPREEGSGRAWPLLSQALEGVRRPGWQLAVAQGDQGGRGVEEVGTGRSDTPPSPDCGHGGGALLEAEVPW